MDNSTGLGQVSKVCVHVLENVAVHLRLLQQKTFITEIELNVTSFISHIGFCSL